MPVETETHAGRATKVVVATSVMLTFISFWRAAAIVLCDLGSSAFYVGGIAEQAVGKVAPWFILGVMCFSYAVRALYVESCAMFTPGRRLSRCQGSNGRHTRATETWSQWPSNASKRNSRDRPSPTSSRRSEDRQ